MSGPVLLYYPLATNEGGDAVELTLTPMTAQDLARLLGELEQGYAEDLVVNRGLTRMIQLIEAELTQFGVPELGLNVFGTNTVAIGLYRGLGFEVTSQQMAKRLTPAS